MKRKGFNFKVKKRTDEPAEEVYIVILRPVVEYDKDENKYKVVRYEVEKEFVEVEE